MPENQYARYAVFWAPPADSPLGKFGSHWLGWDPERRVYRTQPNLAGIERFTAIPRRYGLHATLKAPFRLAQDTDQSQLEKRLAKLARTLPPAKPIALELGLWQGFLALRPTGPTAEIDAIATACVQELDSMRAPSDAGELSRRRRAGLDQAEERNLVQWGYPYVCDTYQFHVTLSSALDESPQAQGLLPRAKALLGDMLRDACRVDTLTLFGDPGHGAPFHVLKRYSLSG